MNRPLMGSWLLMALLIAGGFLVAYQFVEPAPSKHLKLATGSVDGAYYQFGLDMQRVLGQEGIELELLTTAGSLENARLLTTGQADVALLQGGTRLEATADGTEHPAIQALASLYFEAVWIFHRDGVTPETFADLAALRAYRGAPGSGTRALTDELFSLNGIDPATLADPALAADPSQQLTSADLDVIILVAGERSPRVRELMNTPGVSLMNLHRAAAYPLHRRYLSALELPEGAINLAANRPRDHRQLIGVAAMLTARDDLHPALVDLLLMSSPRIVGDAGLFHERGDFPSPRYLSLPLETEARRFHDRGPSFLQSILPFWAATMIDRLIVMLVPLLALVLPLMRLFPPVYRWRVRSRIYRWYEDLKRLEARLDREGVSEELTRAVSNLEQEVKQVETPLSYADELYHLRSHIELVKARAVGDH